MPFLPKPPSYETIMAEWKCGKVTVAVLAYMFGQHRLQVWCDGFGREPDILSPEF